MADLTTNCKEQTVWLVWTSACIAGWSLLTRISCSQLRQVHVWSVLCLRGRVTGGRPNSLTRWGREARGSYSMGCSRGDDINLATSRKKEQDAL